MPGTVPLAIVVAALLVLGTVPLPIGVAVLLVLDTVLLAIGMAARSLGLRDALEKLSGPTPIAVVVRPGPVAQFLAGRVPLFPLGLGYYGQMTGMRHAYP